MSVIASQSLLFTQDDDQTDGWVTIFDASVQGTPLGNSSDLATGRNFRQRISTDFPRQSLVNMRVTYQAAAALGMNITSASVGKMASSGNTYDTDGTQVAITFDGGNPGFAIAAGEEKVSDPVAYAFTETQRLIFALFTDASPDVTGVATWTLSSGEGASTNNGSFLQTVGDINVDTTMVSDVTLGILSGSGQVYGIKKIEVNP